MRTTHVDFHCHSNVSDGYFAPDALARKLADAGVHYAALTDHESIDGLPTFEQAAARRGMAVVTGVELAVQFSGHSLHLLAYGFEPGGGALVPLLGRNPPADEAIARIHQAGGKVFLAHPLEIGLDWEALEQLVAQLAAIGLDGLEACYKPYTREAQAGLAAMADRHRLLVSAGSDFHGPGLAGSREPGHAMAADRWKQFRDALGGIGHDREPSAQPVHPRPRELNWGWFHLRIVLPSLLVIALFIGFYFAFLIPMIEDSLFAFKREMIAEQTNSAWSILAEYEREEQAGRMTPAEARAGAIERIKFMRYGKDGKDYFWITDMHPRMVMHPWREDLDGEDLSQFADPGGVRLFVEFARTVREHGAGYLNYVWQWKDDPERLAPKQSYVRGFEPWGWVIGTGIYIEDVQAEIDTITGRLINVSLLITLAVGMLLVTLSQQSLKAERQRGEAVRDLRLSHEKYRALVESASQGTLLVLDGRLAHANATMLRMLGTTEKELLFLDIHDLLADDEPVAAALERVLAGEESGRPLRARLRRKDGRLIEVSLAPARVSFGGRTGLILNVHDIAPQRQMEEELVLSREKFRILAESINLGVLRVGLDPRATLIEINPAGRRILGRPEEHEPGGLREALAEPEAWDRILRRLQADDAIRDTIIQLRAAGGGLTTVSLSAVLVRGPDGEGRCLDCIIEDLSQRRRAEAERESLISQLQASLLFLNEPVGNSASRALSCPLEMPIARAVALMARHDASALTVTAPDGETIGIVTDHDLRERVIAAGRDTAQPIQSIMSSPVVAVDAGAPVYEAFLLMREKGTRHLVVRGGDGKVAGIVSNKEMARLDRHSPVLLTRQVERAATIEELAQCRRRLTALACSLVDSGALPHNIGRTITAISDAIAERIIGFALEEMGPPPVPFALVAIGSQGREELTLASDQDNALIYADPPREQAAETAAWFLRLGERICADIEQAGQPRCPADMMARNPQWNRPLSAWQQSFTRWIVEPDSEELLRFNIFFDFRRVHGDHSLTRALRRHIQSVLGNQPAFFHHLAANTLLYKPPLSLFGQIVTGSAGAAPHAFNIKDAMLPIVGFARLYALRHQVEHTNTLDRIDQLRLREVLRPDTHRDLAHAYHCLLQLRHRHQVALTREGLVPNNQINPKNLTQIEQGMLKQALAQISTIQKKVGFDFTGQG